MRKRRTQVWGTLFSRIAVLFGGVRSYLDFHRGDRIGEATPDKSGIPDCDLPWQGPLFSMQSYSKRALEECHTQQSSVFVYLGTKSLLELRFLADSCLKSLSGCSNDLGVCVGLLHTASPITKPSAKPKGILTYWVQQRELLLSFWNLRTKKILSVLASLVPEWNL